MSTLFDARLKNLSRVENTSITHSLISLNPTSLKSNIKDNSFISSPHYQTTLNKHPIEWTEENVLDWLRHEELYTEEIVSAFTQNKIDGETLIDLTPEDIKNELEISTLKFRKRLNESITKLKINYENSDLIIIADLMKDDINCNMNSFYKDSEIKTFEIQNQLLDNSIIEINDYKYASRIDNEFKKEYDREEMDNEYARQIDRQLNGERETNRTNIENIEKKDKLNISNNMNYSNDSNSEGNLSTLSNYSNISKVSNLVQNQFFGRATIINKTNKISDPQIINPDDNLIKINIDLPEVKNKITKFNCGVCGLNNFFSPNNIEKLECGCTYCKHCLKDFFIYAERDFTLMPPRCHTKHIKLEVMDMVMNKTEKNNFLAKFEEFNCKNKFYCQNNTCSKFINLDIVKQNPHMCNKCFKYNCIECKTLWHSNITCEKNKLIAKYDNLILNKLKLENNWKSCPQCTIIIDLEFGCNHMTCGMCSYEFCYVCLKKWNGLRCIAGCELFSGKNLDLMTNREVLRRGLNQNNIQVGELNRIRENVRNQNECLHRNATHKYTKGNCVNCSYNLKVYCYQCNDCNEKVCQTCFLYRLR